MKKRNDIGRKLGKLKKSSGRAWGDLRVGTKKTCSILKRLFKKIGSRFK